MKDGTTQNIFEASAKHILFLLLATVVFGLVFIGPSPAGYFSFDGIMIATAGVFLLCFLPAVIIALIVAVIKRNTISPVLMWIIWLVPASLMLIGGK